MSTRIHNRLLAATVTVVGMAALLLPSAAPSATGVAGAKRITPSGVGHIQRGDTFRELRGAGLIGRHVRGCELAGPAARAARLRSPLRGWVEFTHSVPRRVTHITIRGGSARARGVRIGSRASKVRAEFPRARFDHRTDEVFGVTLVRIPRRGGGRLQFAVDTDSRRVTLIGVPSIRFCE